MSLFDSLKIGDLVDVNFGGGISGRTIGTVIGKLGHPGTDCRIRTEHDFWDDLSRRWHRKGDTLIVHSRELVRIIPRAPEEEPAS